MKYYIEALKRYVDFDGRTSLRGYWYFVLFNFIFSITIGIFGAAMNDFNGILQGLYTLALFLPSIGVMIRRFHDINKSGWNSLWMIIPIVNLVLILIWFTQAGDKGKNKYGLPHKS